MELISWSRAPREYAAVAVAVAAAMCGYRILFLPMEEDVTFFLELRDLVIAS
jgi:hypothetical protein